MDRQLLSVLRNKKRRLLPELDKKGKLENNKNAIDGTAVNNFDLGVDCCIST